MTDIGSAAAITAAAGTISAAFAYLFGVDPQTVMYATIGGVIGLSWAPPMKRLRALSVFVCAVLGSAILAAFLTRWWLEPEKFAQYGELARNGLSFVLGGVFHPLTAAVIGGIPRFIEGLVDRIKGAP